MEETELVKELEKLGWKYVYYTGNGDICPVEGFDGSVLQIVGAIEKSQILVPPDCLWDIPIKYEDYY